jgi:hypothetical protein
MREVLVLYTFVGLMALNLLVSFIYLVGFNQLREGLRRAYHDFTERPR